MIGASHLVELEKSTRLHSILDVDTLTVNSYHHQAVDKISKNLRITAHAKDGVVEGLEFPGERFGLFVQWHPERMPKEHREKVFGVYDDGVQVTSGFKDKMLLHYDFVKHLDKNIRLDCWMELRDKSSMSYKQNSGMNPDREAG